MNNTFYHNVFMNNTKNVKFYSDLVVSGNFWDNGVGGNYWSDYSGADADNDGVGDTPYRINTENNDYYPLITPLDIPEVTVPPLEYNSPLDLPESSSSTTSTSTPASTLTPEIAPTPSPTPSATTVPVITDNGTTVDLIISGNVTNSQMSNISLTLNQSASMTKLSFTVIGENGTTGLGNITIPKSTVAYGTTPTIYIDDQPAQDQGYTQDANNFYVWYTTHFSTHKVTIMFTSTSTSLTQEVIHGIMIGVVIMAIVIMLIVLLEKKAKRS